MHNARQRMINNKTLTQSAVQVGLPAFVDSRPFVSKQWMPPYFFVSQSSDSLLVSSQSGQSSRVYNGQYAETPALQTWK
jgi:hypothetical protein